MHNKRINELADKFLYSGRCLRAQTIFNHAEGDSHASTLDHPSLTDFNLLTSSMICFYLETMSLYSDVITKTSQQWHHVVVAKISSEFLSLRAAEKVARDGYPWLAVPMLRNSHDRIVILSSCLQEPENFPIAVGIADGNRCPDRAKQMRKSYEQTTAARMTGRESGLSKECRSYMQKVDRRYDEETHPALLSFAQRITAWQSGGGLPVVPEFDPVGFAMFMTRHCEVSWMAHRILPAIQPRGSTLPDEWKDNWRAIDFACQELVRVMRTPDGGDVGSLIIEFVNKKFPFNADTVCRTT